MKKGFTLIELLAVIMILTILSLILTPVIINVINSAKDKSDLESVHGILESARLYYSESMMDNDKKNDIENINNIYEKVSLSVKEKTGELYINEKGLSAIAVVIRNKCYTKQFSGNIQISENITNCTLGFVGIDTTAPTVSFSVLDGTFNSNGWAKNNINVNITINDNESGPSSYKYCIDTKDCEPIALVNNSTGFSEINTESETNKVCVIGIDNYGNESSIICSDNYKLDKTNPTIAINNISINKNTTLDLNSDVITNDSLSGVDNYTYDPTSVDTSVAGDKTVTYTVRDKAGNSASIDRTITVITDKPTIAYSTLTSPNGNGWFNSDFYIKAIATSDSTSSIDNIKWCSSTSDCTPTTILETDNVTAYITNNSATNKMCIQAVDTTGNTSDVICSSNYKLDTIAPTAGTATFTGTLGSNNWYTSNVTITPTGGSDSLSGIASSTVNINNITTNTTGTIITVTTSDLAGNVASSTQTVKVDKNAPIITLISSNISINKGSSNMIYQYFNTSYSISGGSISCNPINTNTLAEGNQVASCTAIGGNGLNMTSTINISVIVPSDNEIAISCIDGETQCTSFAVMEDGTVGFLNTFIHAIDTNYPWPKFRNLSNVKDISISCINDNYKCVSFAVMKDGTVGFLNTFIHAIDQEYPWPKFNNLSGVENIKTSCIDGETQCVSFALMKDGTVRYLNSYIHAMDVNSTWLKFNNLSNVKDISISCINDNYKCVSFATMEDGTVKFLNTFIHAIDQDYPWPKFNNLSGVKGTSTSCIDSKTQCVSLATMEDGTVRYLNSYIHAMEEDSTWPKFNNLSNVKDTSISCVDENYICTSFATIKDGTVRALDTFIHAIDQEYPWPKFNNLSNIKDTSISCIDQNYICTSFAATNDGTVKFLNTFIHAIDQEYPWPQFNNLFGVK